MDFFISNAWAQGAPGQGSPYSMLIMMVVLFALFYFMLIRPQQKRAKEHQAMIQALKKGDEVVTTGGALGKVTEVGDNFISIEIASNTVIKVQRNAVGQLMPKGTVKGA